MKIAHQEQIEFIFDFLIRETEWSDVELDSYSAPLAKSLRALIVDSARRFFDDYCDEIYPENIPPQKQEQAVSAYLKLLQENSIYRTAGAERTVVKEAMMEYIMKP